MRVAVDASVVIDYLKQGGTGTGAGRLFLELVEREVDMEISAVTVAELYAGRSAQSGGRQRVEIDEIVGGMTINKPSWEMAKLVGGMRYKYKLSLQDAFIAALAIEEGMPLVTLDKKAFSRVSGIKFYGVEWRRKGE